ncbi:MAG: exodeoxyribonuclease VII large subunit [Sedimentisphaerales bacterium]|nr:exodeoxyribonuclease VII large subunit [Sedimentisphaerales bacterium]
MARNIPKTYSVSEINALIRVTLEGGLPSRLTVSGQISGFKRHSSGHCYFSLKDQNSLLTCVMWKSKFSTVKFAPEDGLAVLATGHIDVYEPTGRYQFYVDRLQPAGVGALQLAFEQMVKRLQAEGLFDEKHKKPLPRYPMRIGIVTSQSGAAFADIRDSIKNRWPCARLFLFPVPVQGEGAAQEIAQTVREVNRRNRTSRPDLLIVGRGGGSLEDLWTFNEESVARAIFDSQIPVISAVGHEVDITIADLVADARASTPTKAGVIAVPDIREIKAILSQAQNRLTVGLRSGLRVSQQRLAAVLASRVFRDPMGALSVPIQRLDELQIRMIHAARQNCNALQRQLTEAYELLRQIEPRDLLARQRLRVSELAGSLQQTIRASIAQKQLQRTALENKLQALNPRSVLQRGYSITSSRETGQVLVRDDQVEIGEVIVTELASGRIESRTIKGNSDQKSEFSNGKTEENE